MLLFGFEIENCEGIIFDLTQQTDRDFAGYLTNHGLLIRV